MTDPTEDQSEVAPVLRTDDARAGYETGKNRWILAISFAAIVVIFWILLRNWFGTD